jgi:5,10-methylenetetrahydromethanopterin reductase
VGEVAQLRTGVWFPGGESIGEMAAAASVAEDARIDSIWVAEGIMGRDAFVALTAIAGATGRVALGTGIVNPYARHPAQLAAAFASLDEACGGRAVCGVGIGARDQLVRLGYDVSRSLAAAREAVELLRRLLARETVDFEGKKFQARGVRLGFRPPRPEMPIYLAATGPKMCALAGEIADGIYLPYGVPAFLRSAIEQTRERRPSDGGFDVACQILVSVDDDRELAVSRVKASLGLILTEPNGESVMEANGLDPASVQPLRDALGDGGIRGMVSVIDDDVVDHLAIVGSRDECVAKLRAAIDCGVTHVQASLLGDGASSTLDVLGAVRER